MDGKSSLMPVGAMTLDLVAVAPNKGLKLAARVD